MTDDDQGLAERIIGAMVAKDAFSRHLGMEVVEIRPNAAAVRMTVRSDMLNGFGVCHGGATFALADSALAFASNTHGRVTVSIESSITFPKGVFEGDVLTATALQESDTNRLSFYRVTVTRSPGETVALFRGIVYKTSQDFFQEQE